MDMSKIEKDMEQHTHIDQQARLPEECPACKVVWDTIDFTIRFDDLDYARSLREEYGEKEMLHYLTRARKKLQTEAWHTGRGR